MHAGKSSPIPCTLRRSRPTGRLARLALTALIGLATGAVQAAGPCNAEAYRAFDFWLGDWQVHAANGKLAGHNRIERGYGGCVLHERYTTPGGYAGESLNMYDAGRRRWHQTWVDNGGLLLRLEGVPNDRGMVLEGETTGRDGAVTRHRITWSPQADGSVRQHWESTDDRGQWKTAFDGRYTRRKAD